MGNLLLILAVFSLPALVIYGFRQRRASNALVAHITNGPGAFDIDVVGESFHQDWLDGITGGKTVSGHRMEVDARLILEANNPHDPKAVRVEIHGKPIGHLSRENARAFRKQLAKAAGPSVSLATCRAIIVGGWDRGHNDDGHYGVKLDLPIAR